MRLGFWNRLAVVATVLAVVITPVWVVGDYMNDAQARNSAIYDLCMKLSGTNVDQAAAEAQCREEYISATVDPDPSLWWASALSAFVACAAIYLLTWAIVAAARWVWRGRIEHTSAKLGR